MLLERVSVKVKTSQHGENLPQCCYGCFTDYDIIWDWKKCRLDLLLVKLFVVWKYFPDSRLWQDSELLAAWRLDSAIIIIIMSSLADSRHKSLPICFSSFLSYLFFFLNISFFSREIPIISPVEKWAVSHLLGKVIVKGCIEPLLLFKNWHPPSNTHTHTHKYYHRSCRCGTSGCRN